MKTILKTLLVLLLLTSCDNEPIKEDCKCKGAFLLENTDRPFYAAEVDCETGTPVINNYPQINIHFLGCVDEID